MKMHIVEQKHANWFLSRHRMSWWNILYIIKFSSLLESISLIMWQLL